MSDMSKAVQRPQAIGMALAIPDHSKKSVFYSTLEILVTK